jgi:acyl dehydratase
MPLDYERLLNWKIPTVEQRYGEADVILYALGLGLGLGIDDPHQLRYVYEKSLQILPTQAAVLGYPGFWLSDPNTGLDWKQVLHGEQSLTVHRPLDVAGAVIGRSRVTSIVDKGQGKGALLYSIRELLDQRTEELLCTLGTTHVLRGEGGFGGPSEPISPPPPLPTGAPDVTYDLPTSRQTALIYRLSGDRNPLHADPDIAKAAGFPRPILHGLASFGLAGYAIIKRFCNGEAARLRTISVRFSAPVFPGETLRIEMWRSGAAHCLFRSRVAERDTLVLNNGLAQFSMEPGT